MIDIHTHILPCVDDGAKTVEESVEMLQKLQKQGVTEVALTPHYYGKRYSAKQFLEKRNASFAQIQNFIPEGIKVRLGAEVALSGVNDPRDEALCALAIEGTKCVLVELPFYSRWSNSLFNRIADFVSETDYLPIVAHIERYKTALKHPETVARLVDMGCLIQLNVRAFRDKKTKRFAYALLKHGLVHCLGTDAHDLKHRPPEYADIKAEVENAGYVSEWYEAQTRMKNAVRGELVDRRYTPVKKLFRCYL